MRVGVAGARFLAACRYLTVLPLPRETEPADLGRAAGWLPVAGLVLGILLAGVATVSALLAPGLLAAALVVAAWAFLTGGLHLDGLADAADGLGGGWSREECLAIMRDARTGAYGTTALVLVLVVKTAALAALPWEVAWRALVVAPVLARAAPVLLARLSPPARGEGAGQAFALSVGPGALAGAGLVTVGAALALLGLWALVPTAATLVATVAFAGYLRRRLGGLTGDCLGALVESVEALVLTTLAALAHRGVM